jgi:xanthine/uracil permease
MKKKIAYRITIYIIILGLIAGISFVPNANASTASIAYYIIGGILLALFIGFVIFNEISIWKKSKDKNEKHH